MSEEPRSKYAHPQEEELSETVRAVAVAQDAAYFREHPEERYYTRPVLAGEFPKGTELWANFLNEDGPQVTVVRLCAGVAVRIPVPIPIAVPMAAMSRGRAVAELAALFLLEGGGYLSCYTEDMGPANKPV